MNLVSIKLVYGATEEIIYTDLKSAFERLKWFLRIQKETKPKLNLYYDDGRHLQFFYNEKANYIEVEALNWK